MIMNNNKRSTGYHHFTYMDHLDEKTTDLLNDIVVKKTEDNEYGVISSWMNKNSKTCDISVNSENSETTKKIIEIATTFFNNAGFNVSKNDGYISYISYSYNSLKYAEIDDWIDNIYCANEGFVDVHECIIVTKKGENLKDGNMEVYKKNPNTFLNLFGYEEEDKDVYKLKTGTVLVFNGDTLHKLQSFKGNGSFNYIMVILRDVLSYDKDL
jgi:hypothetical protein